MWREFVNWKVVLFLLALAGVIYINPFIGGVIAMKSAILAVFSWPLFVVAIYRRLQDRVLDRIKANYAVGLEAFAAGRVKDAEAVLETLRQAEAIWRRRNGTSYKSGVLSFVVVSNVAFAIAYMYGPQIIIMAHSSAPGGIVAAMVKDFQIMPWYVWAIFGFGVFSMGAWPVLEMGRSSLNSYRWVDHYGDQLAQILRAGRGLKVKQKRKPKLLPQAGTAHELLGLNPIFTSAELRRAWLGLVRELHPDRWAMVPASVRLAKEEALKRVNAAKDELQPFAR